MVKKEIKLFHGNVYKYINNGMQYIGVYLCDTNLAKKICMVPLNLNVDEEDEAHGYYHIKSLDMDIFPYHSTEIERKNILDVLWLKGKIAKLTYEEYVTLSDAVIHRLAKKIFATYSKFTTKRLDNDNDENYILTEDYYKYITWFEHKSNLQFDRNIKRNPIIRKYCIYYAEIGENIGSELHKMRPVVIFKCLKSNNPNNSSYIAIPITSKSSSSKYSFNTPILVNGKINYVRTNDIRRISIKRIVGPLFKSGTSEIWRLSPEEINLVNKNFKDYFIE